MIYLLIFLQLADAATTLYFLKHTRLTEANPILRWAFEKFGAGPSLFGLKGAYCATIWYWYDAIPEWTVQAIIVFYVGVVLWNWHHIQKTRTSEA